MLPDKIKLNDDERSRVRWSSTKRGFIVRTEFQKDWTRRGPRDIRPMRSRVFVTEHDARRNAADVRNRPLIVQGTRRPCIVAEVQVLEVDALGNVVNLVDVV